MYHTYDQNCYNSSYETDSQANVMKTHKAIPPKKLGEILCSACSGIYTYNAICKRQGR